jgi:hypothetical protein
MMARLTRNYLKHKLLDHGPRYQMLPSDTFPIDVSETTTGRASEYVPVTVADLLVQRAQAQRRARSIEAVVALDDINQRLEWLEKIVSRYGYDTQSTVLFFLLGYDINTADVIDASKVRSLDAFLDWLGFDRDPYKRIRARATLAPHKEVFLEEVLDLREQRERQDEFTQSVVVPLGLIEARVNAEIGMFIIGGEVFRGVLEIASWVARVSGARMLLAELIGLGRLSGAGRLVVGFLLKLRNVAKRLFDLLMFLLTLKWIGRVSLEVFGEVRTIYSYLMVSVEEERRNLEVGIELYDGWCVSADPSDDAFCRYLFAETMRIARDRTRTGNY